MRIWLLKIGEPVPTDATNVRLLRMGLLAEQLTRRGHEVVWWTSTFDHRRKCQRFDNTTKTQLSDNYQLVTLRSPGYRKNISLQRMLDHEIVARKFRQATKDAARPDVILAALPTLELGRAAAKYAHANDVPLVVDVRDMWPDVFGRALPRLGQMAAAPLLRYFDRMAREVCHSATAITGHTEEFVDWGLLKAGRASNQWDRHFPFAYHQHPVGEELKAEARAYWQQQHVLGASEQKIVSFVGTLSHQFALEPVIEAAHKLSESKNVTFVIAGDGEKRAQWMDATKHCSNVVWPGWIDTPKIQVLLEHSTLALAPYHNTPDFAMSIPNKVIEYLASGTPVLTSLEESSMNQLLTQSGCGQSYAGDAQQLANLVLRLTTDDATRRAMSERATQIFQQRFAAEKVYGEMIHLLERIAGTCAQGSDIGLAA